MNLRWTEVIRSPHISARSTSATDVQASHVNPYEVKSAGGVSNKRGTAFDLLASYHCSMSRAAGAVKPSAQIDHSNRILIVNKKRLHRTLVPQHDTRLRGNVREIARNGTSMIKQ